MILRLLPQAEADIGKIAVYIAHDNTLAARRWIASIRKTCNLIALTTGLGVARDEIRPGLRMMPTGNYVILYRQVKDAVEIVRVVDGRRNWGMLF